LAGVTGGNEVVAGPSFGLAGSVAWEVIVRFNDRAVPPKPGEAGVVLRKP